MIETGLSAFGSFQLNLGLSKNIDAFETHNIKVSIHPYEFPQAVCKAKMIAK